MIDSPSCETTGLESLVAGVLDEYRERINRGERPTIEEYVERHPEAADLLRNVLATIDLLGLSLSGAGANPDDPATATLGDFRLIREVGRGGMGIVYEAEQISLSRRVALKVLPFAGAMDPKQIQRFKNEAKAAASLKHDHIVSVHAIGCERGVHFYAMEFVEGQTLAETIAEIKRQREEVNHRDTEDTEKRKAEQRENQTADYHSRATEDTKIREITRPMSSLCSLCLCGKKSSFFRHAAELIAHAADALEHAHSLGIVHRDVKPGNLLLDTAGQVYVSDFGLARLGADAGLTISGDMVGTLRYMAPEQALARHGLVDHRADIYGLGCTLYELLTGRPVVDGTDRADILRGIAFEEPTPLRKLDKSIPQELETITLKCLAKNPNERYATPGEVADDLRRWLGDQTIKAKPPGMFQRVQRLARRHRAMVTTGIAGVFLFLIVGGIGVLLSNARLQEEKQFTQQQKTEAQDQAAIAQAVNDFLLNDLLAEAAPEKNARNKKVTVEEVLGRAAARIAGKFDKQPRVEAAIRQTIGDTYETLGDYPASVQHLERATEIYRSIFGEEHPRTLASMDNLALSYGHLGRYADALKLHEKTLVIKEAMFGPDHADTLGCRCNLASDYRSVGQLAKALELFESTLVVMKVKIPDHEHTFICMLELADTYDALARHADALKLREETLPLTQAKLGLDHPHTLACIGTLANTYASLGRYADALKLREESLPLFKARFGPDHPKTLWSMTGLASSYHDVGRYADASKLHEETLALKKSKLGPDHPATLQSMVCLANCYFSVGKHADALRLDEETLALKKAKFGPDHPSTLNSMNSLAVSYRELGRHADALKLNEEALALSKTKLGPEHPTTLNIMHNQANNYAAVGRKDEALNLREQTLALRKLKSGPDHPATLHAMYNLANSFTDVGRHADALKLHEQTMVLRETKLGPGHPETLESRRGLAWYLANCTDAKLRDPRRAVELAKRAVELKPSAGDIQNTLGVASYRAGDWNAAVTALEKSVTLQVGDSFDWFFLAMAYWQLGDKEKARSCFDNGVQWMDKNKPQDEELRRYRAEAAELLNVNAGGANSK